MGRLGRKRPIGLSSLFYVSMLLGLCRWTLGQLTTVVGRYFIGQRIPGSFPIPTEVAGSHRQGKNVSGYKIWVPIGARNINLALQISVQLSLHKKMMAGPGSPSLGKLLPYKTKQKELLSLYSGWGFRALQGLRWPYTSRLLNDRGNPAAVHLLVHHSSRFFVF